MSPDGTVWMPVPMHISLVAALHATQPKLLPTSSVMQLCHCFSETFILIKLILCWQNYDKAIKAQLRNHYL